MKPICIICGERDLGCDQFGCWRSLARSGAAGMVREAIVKERKVNVVNLIVGGAFLVVIVALVLEVAHVL